MTKRNSLKSYEERLTASERGQTSQRAKTFRALRDLVGPASTKEKLLFLQLTNFGISPKQIPKTLRNNTVARSRKNDPMGQILVKRMSGVEGPAVPIVKKFEETIGSQDDLIEKLELIEDKLTGPEKNFLESLRTNTQKKGLPRLIAEAKVSPSKILRYYAEGAVALGKVHAAIAISREQPLLVKDLVRNALDHTTVCKTCVGTGKVKRQSNDKKEETLCPSCDGSGTKYGSSKHKEFAMTKALEIGGLVEKPARGGVNVEVSQNVGVKVGGGGFMERVLKTSDEILYGRQTVDALLLDAPNSTSLPEGKDVQPKDNSS